MLQNGNLSGSASLGGHRPTFGKQPQMPAMHTSSSQSGHAYAVWTDMESNSVSVVVTSNLVIWYAFSER